MPGRAGAGLAVAADPATDQKTGRAVAHAAAATGLMTGRAAAHEATAPGTTTATAMPISATWTRTGALTLTAPVAMAGTDVVGLWSKKRL
jgi:hypothetical protein